MTIYASEPGTRLGGRYRLEDRIATGSGWAAWKAIDETLARAVTVFTFAAGFPRVAEVVTAARAASRLTDPRLAQVFDVEDAWDRAYIVMEWAAGETLGDLLSQGPLAPHRAARMIADAAGALASAHAAGVAHMCLSPGSVRWSPTGEVKVVGLGLDAALSGVAVDEPVLVDTTGLGRLLYAALTGHWPGPDYPSLPPAPSSAGQPCSPRQVVAGVPIALSDLTVRAMQLRTSQGTEPVTTPGDLARALLAALPPEPPPAALAPAAWRQQPRYPEDPRYGPGRREDRMQADRREPVRHADAGWAADGGPADDRWPADDRDWTGGMPQHGRQRAETGPAPHRRRAARGGPARLPRGVIFAGAGVLALVAIAAFTLWPSGSGSPSRQRPSGRPTTQAAATVLQPAGATGFDPLTSRHDDPGNEESHLAKYAIDSSLRTAWTSQWYKTADFGLLKTGSGLLLDMGKPVKMSSVTVMFAAQPGADVKLLVGNSDQRSKANLDSMTTVASATSPTGTYTFQIKNPVAGQFLVIWFTQLPPEPHSAGRFRAEIFNVTVKGTA